MSELVPDQPAPFQSPEAQQLGQKFDYALMELPDYDALSDDALMEVGEALAAAAYDISEQLDKIAADIERRGLDDESPENQP